MSLKEKWKRLNLGKGFGYGFASAGGALFALDAFRLASGDAAANASLAQNFLSYAGAVLAGVSFAKASNPTPQPAPVQRVIMPQQRLITL